MGTLTHSQHLLERQYSRAPGILEISGGWLGQETFHWHCYSHLGKKVMIQITVLPQPKPFCDSVTDTVGAKEMREAE